MKKPLIYQYNEDFHTWVLVLRKTFWVYENDQWKKGYDQILPIICPENYKILEYK